MAVGISDTVNVDVLVFPRIYYAMAKGEYFSKSFANIDKNDGVDYDDDTMQ